MYRFLLIDDSRVMRRLLQNTLKASGYEQCEYMEAVDGTDALEKLEAADYRFDVVFCDLCMPKMDGLGLIDELGNRGVLTDLAIIVCTGDIREARGREALAKGARKLICKPFTTEGVHEVVEEVLRERQRI